MSHTPTPWTLDETDLPFIINGPAASPASDDDIEQVHIATIPVYGPNSRMAYSADVAQANAQRIIRCVNHHDALVAALVTMRERYGRLHDALSDCIESGRLDESHIPDDYKALADMLEACCGADHVAEAALANLGPMYRATWGSGFSHQGTAIHPLSFFCDANAYEEETERAEIAALAVGETWTSRHYATHTVTRIQ